MCVLSKPKIPAAPVIPAPDGREATRQADLEARRRRARGSAAGAILTSPSGIPSTRQLGVPA